MSGKRVQGPGQNRHRHPVGGVRPGEDLGLIVMDEEQEHTYKSESSPRYDAREVARFRCGKDRGLLPAVLRHPLHGILRMAQEGKFHFHKLEERFGQAQIPQVELVDMNLEDVPGSGRAIGPTLARALVENFQRAGQSIVLLKPPGGTTPLCPCSSCHEVVSCPNCSISLTYHSGQPPADVPLLRVFRAPDGRLPLCGSHSLSFRGLGTQRAEEQLQELLPEAKVLRVDTDAVTEKFSWSGSWRISPRAPTTSWWAPRWWPRGWILRT